MSRRSRVPARRPPASRSALRLWLLATAACVPLVFVGCGGSREGEIPLEKSPAELQAEEDAFTDEVRAADAAAGY